MNEYKIGEFGQASFKYEKKDFREGLTAYGTIKDIDGRYVLFVDNDGFPYLVRRDKFSFEKKEGK